METRVLIEFITCRNSMYVMTIIRLAIIMVSKLLFRIKIKNMVFNCWTHFWLFQLLIWIGLSSARNRFSIFQHYQILILVCQSITIFFSQWLRFGVLMNGHNATTSHVFVVNSFWKQYSKLTLILFHVLRGDGWCYAVLTMPYWVNIIKKEKG